MTRFRRILPVVGVALGAAIAVPLVASATAPPGSTEPTSSVPESSVPESSSSGSTEPVAAAPVRWMEVVEEADPETYAGGAATRELVDDARVLMIGDSIMASTSSRYGGEMCKELVPRGWDVEMDAESGRFVDFGDRVLDSRLDCRMGRRRRHARQQLRRRQGGLRRVPRGHRRPLGAAPDGAAHRHRVPPRPCRCQRRHLRDRRRLRQRPRRRLGRRDRRRSDARRWRRAAPQQRGPGPLRRRRRPGARPGARLRRGRLPRLRLHRRLRRDHPRRRAGAPGQQPGRRWRWWRWRNRGPDHHPARPASSDAPDRHRAADHRGHRAASDICRQRRR